MNKDIQRMQMVLPKSEFDRIQEDKEDGYVVDLHRLKKNEGKRLVNNMINLTTHPCRISVIHGFNKGTVLQQTVRTDIKNPKIRRIITVDYNPGITYLDIA